MPRVEKRDNPDIRDKPVIIGGGRRGVVSTACYIARIKGVQSAMPMFKALELCPEAVVVRGRMDVYVEVSKQVRALMEELTPAIEPLSLDEAFLDLTGTQRLHGVPPAVMLARLTKRMKDEIGITGSIGLSHNKFLAKVASDLDKPRGFSVIGKAETADFLRDKPVRLIWGVGHGHADQPGRRRHPHLRRPAALGPHRPARPLRPHGRPPVSSGTGRGSPPRVAQRADEIDVERDHVPRRHRQPRHPGRPYLAAGRKGVGPAQGQGHRGRIVTLKLKRANHSLLTKRTSLSDPTQIADRIYHAARDLFDLVGDQGPYRLLGVGLSDLGSAEGADLSGDLLDPQAQRRAMAERATDRIRERFGADAIVKGRALR